MGDEVMGVSKFCRGDDFLICGFKVSEADVLHDGSSEELGLLENYAEGTA